MLQIYADGVQVGPFSDKIPNGKTQPQIMSVCFDVNRFTHIAYGKSAAAPLKRPQGKSSVIGAWPINAAQSRVKILPIPCGCRFSILRHGGQN